MSVFDRVYDMLQEGPLTAFDVACELDVTSAYASAILCQLRDIGQVQVTGVDHHNPGRAAHIYELTP